MEGKVWWEVCVGKGISMTRGADLLVVCLSGRRGRRWLWLIFHHALLLVFQAAKIQKFAAFLYRNLNLTETVVVSWSLAKQPRADRFNLLLWGLQIKHHNWCFFPLKKLETLKTESPPSFEDPNDRMQLIRSFHLLRCCLDELQPRLQQQTWLAFISCHLP